MSSTKNNNMCIEDTKILSCWFEEIKNVIVVDFQKRTLADNLRVVLQSQIDNIKNREPMYRFQHDIQIDILDRNT